MLATFNSVVANEFDTWEVELKNNINQQQIKTDVLSSKLFSSETNIYTI